MECDYESKFITVGDAGVGKTCLMWSFIDKSFDPKQDFTAGVEVGFERINVNDLIINLHIWDTAGSKMFRSISKTFFKNAVGVILVYDITRRETFDHLDFWLGEFKHDIHPNATIVLVGNKSDLDKQRAVTIEEGDEFAKTHGMIFLEASAKTSHNVEEVFMMPLIEVNQKIQQGEINISHNSLGVILGDGRTKNSRRKDWAFNCCIM